MSSIQKLTNSKMSKHNNKFSDFRAIIESNFYGNNVHQVNSVEEAYNLAVKTSGTIITDIPVFNYEALDLPKNSKVLVNNNGSVVGRTSAARKIIGQPNVDSKELAKILREAMYLGGLKKYYSSEVIVGLDESFMLKAHIMLPKNFESTLYSYMLNFQFLNKDSQNRYTNSNKFSENELYIYGDPEWTHPDYPFGLVIFDPQHNVAAILGLRYFGEFKKATLTLAWGVAHRNGFISCHGGMKQYRFKDSAYTMAAFGLSGSGKSTITLANHNDKYDMVVLHDDAFVISKENGMTTALEPSYFDKTQDYPMGSEAIKYYLTCQNVGVTLDEFGNKILVTEDIRNGNGRTVKSRFSTPDRVDHLKEKIDAVYWIMKDESLPPMIKINDPVLAAVFGATLATKRSSAENIVVDDDANDLVIEPFANPFRSYPLKEDYSDFINLFLSQKTNCYILNTGYFNGKKVTPLDTLTSIEKVVEGQAAFRPFGTIESISYLPVEGHLPDFDDPIYANKLKQSMKNRLAFILKMNVENNGYNALPVEAEQKMREIISKLN